MAQQWMIYGVTGYTGQRIVKEAVKRGHKPVLAGRNEAKVKAIADEHGLQYQVIDLSDTATLEAAVAAVDLVFHTAGPYVVTAEPMIQACLKGKTHYVDITGEASVFARIFELSEQAKNAGVCLVSGIGFDVIPTDCLIAHVAKKIENPESIQMAIAPRVRPSAGTAKSALGVIASGKAEIRKNGKIVQVPFGSESFSVEFPGSTQTVAIAPIADVYTAHYSTGASDVKTYMAQPKLAAIGARFTMPVLAMALRNTWFKQKIETLIDKNVKGADENFAQVGYAEVWAKATNAKGEVAEGYLRTCEVYVLTVQVSVRFVEHVLAKNPSGSFAPAQIFPMEDLLAIEGVQLFDGKRERVMVV